MPSAGVVFEPDALMRSSTTKPGSPVRHAHSAIASKTSLARNFPAGLPVRGLINSYSASASTASMKAASTPTETLKLTMTSAAVFMRMKSMISG